MSPFKLNTATTEAWKCREANLLNLLKFEKNVGPENGFLRAKKGVWKTPRLEYLNIAMHNTKSFADKKKTNLYHTL